MDDQITCPYCGQYNQINLKACSACGKDIPEVLDAPTQPQVEGTSYGIDADKISVMIAKKTTDELLSMLNNAYDWQPQIIAVAKVEIKQRGVNIDDIVPSSLDSQPHSPSSHNPTSEPVDGTLKADLVDQACRRLVVSAFIALFFICLFMMNAWWQGAILLCLFVGELVSAYLLYKIPSVKEMQFCCQFLIAEAILFACFALTAGWLWIGGIFYVYRTYITYEDLSDRLP